MATLIIKKRVTETTENFSDIMVEAIMQELADAANKHVAKKEIERLDFQQRMNRAEYRFTMSPFKTLKR